jgi:hypothetical protein
MKVELTEGDITACEADVIVNAATPEHLREAWLVRYGRASFETALTVFRG